MGYDALHWHIIKVLTYGGKDNPQFEWLVIFRVSWLLEKGDYPDYFIMEQRFLSRFRTELEDV